MAGRLTRAAMAATVAAGLAVPAAAGILSGFKNSLIEFALDQISVPDTMEIAAERIEDPDDGFVRLGGVTIADKNGVWMSIDELTLSWNVSRILRAELEIGNLAAKGVRIERAPNPEDVDVEVKEGSELDRSLGGIFDWPRSPIDTRIDRMALEDVFIAEGVMAVQSLSFDAEGSARDEGDIQAVDLTVARTDDVEGSIVLDYSRDFGADTLTLLLTAKEDPGGIVAELFGLPNDAASTVTLDADGPLSDWQLEFAAQTTDIYTAVGNATVQTGTPFHISANFEIQPGPNMSATNRDLMSPKATFTLAVSEDEDGVVSIETGELSARHLNGTATGTYDRPSGTVDLDVSLVAEGGVAQSIEGVVFDRFSFEGSVDGPTGDLTATGALNLDGLETASLDVDDAELTVTVSVAGPKVGADLEGEISGVRLDRLSREQMGTARIDGAIGYDAEILSLDGFSIVSPLIELAASGTVDLAEDGVADLTYRVVAPDLGPVARAYDVNADGALAVEGALAGALAEPRLAGEATLTDLVFDGTGYGEVSLSHDVALGEEPQGTVDLRASGSPVGPAAVDTAFVLTADQELRLTEMTAEALGITANGRATAHLDTSLVAGDLRIDATDLSELGDYLDAPIGGGGTGTLILSIDDGRQMADADVEIASLTAPGLKVGSGVLRIDLDDALGTPRIDAKLDGGSLEAAGIRVDRVNGSFVSRDGGEVADVALNLLNTEGEGFAIPSARLGGTVTEPFGDVAFDLGLSVAEIEGEALSAGTISGSFVGTPRLERVDVDLALDGFAAAGASGDRVVIDAVVRDALGEAAIGADLLAEGLAYDGEALGRLTATVETTAALETLRARADLSGGTMIRSMTFAGLITDPAGTPGINADISLEGLDYRDYRVGSFRGTVDSTAVDGAMALDVIVTDFAGAGATGSRAVVDGTVREPFSDFPKADAELTVDGLTYDGVRLGTLAGTVDTADDGRSVGFDLSLSGVDGQGLTVDAAEVAGTITDPTGTPGIDADLTVRRLSFRDVTMAELTGTVRSTEERDRLDLDLVLADLATRGVRVRRATVDGFVAEPFAGRPRPTADIAVEGLGYGADTVGDLTVRLATSEAADRIDVDLVLASPDPATRAVIDGAVIDPFGTPLVDADLDIAAFRLGDLIAIEKALGTVKTAAEGDRITADLELAGVRGFGLTIGGADIEGRVNDPFGDALEVDADVTARTFRWQDELSIGAIDGVVRSDAGLGRVEVDATAQDFDGFGVRFEAADLDGVVLEALGGLPGYDGTVDARNFAYEDLVRIGRVNGTVDAKPGLATIDLDVNVDGMEGFGAALTSADVTGTLTDPLGAVGFDGEVRARQVRYGAYRVGRVAAVIEGPPGLETVDVQATVDEVSGGGVGLASGTIDATATGVLSDSIGVEGTAELSDLRAAGGRIGRLDLSYDLENVAGSPTGTVNGTARPIDIAGITAAHGDLAARLTDKDGKTGIVADLGLATVNLGPATVDRVRIDATVGDALGTPVLDIRTEASAADFGFARLDGALVTAKGPLGGLAIGARTEGVRVPYPGAADPLSFVTEARLDLSGGLSGRVTTLALDVGDDKITLNGPLTIRAQGDATRLSGIDVGIPGGSVTGDLTIHGRGIAGDLQIEIPDPEPLARLVNVPIDQGDIRATAEFDTRPGPAHATINVKGSALRFRNVEDALGTLDLEFATNWNGRTADSVLSVTGPFDEPIRGRLALPLRATGGLVPEVPANASIDGSLVWQGDIGTFWPLVPAIDHVVDGPVDIDLKVSGPVSGPVVSGNVTMTGGRYENLELGTILTDLNVRTEVASAAEFKVSIDAGDAGRAKVTGEVSVGPGGLDAELSTRDAILVRRDDVTAAVGFDITARGPLDAPRVAGEITIERAEVRLVSLTPPTVATLGDVRIKGERRRPPRPPAGGAVTLDLKVRARDDVFVRGRGLDSEWEMSLDISGRASAPRIQGDITRRRGRLTLIGRQFDLEEGEIRFRGETPINPTLNVRLTREEEGVVGGIWVHGKADEPEVDFVSEPALPEDEVLPRVLFGRSKQSLAAAEAVQLAAGVATLLSGTGGTIDRLRNAVGIDVLRVDSTGETKSVTVGQNVADEVFVGVKQPIDGGPATVEIEIELHENLDLNSEVGGAGSAVGLKWKKDF